MSLLISRGVPMLLGGDELRRTQRGNNNAYCHDNGTSWYDWRYLGAPRGARRTEVLEPQRITPELLEELHQLSAFDPEHLPEEILLTEAFHRRFADLTQIACFDTAFHHDMPRVAKQLPIPRRYEALGARRYGFHGLSYAYLIEELERVAGTKAAHGRVILAHLGNGASLAAVRDGQSVDTTMAFTPAAGLMMSPDRRRTDDCQGGESPARS